MQLGPACVVALCALGVAPIASAEVVPKRVVIVGQAAPGAPWKTGPTEARIDDKPRLSIAVIAREGRRRVYIADDAVSPLIIDRRRIPARARRGWDALPGAEVRWSTIEPHAWRDRSKREFHSNVSTDKRTWGRWIGYSKVEYFATRLSGFSSKPSARVRRAEIRSSDPETRGATLGTIRYQVELRHRGRVLASPGIEATDRAGISTRVHRVTIRRDDTFVGHLTGFFLVPEIFGSAGRGRDHQTDRYVGADCADVLTGAARASGMRHLPYSNVASMHRWARKIAGPVELDARGDPATPIRGVAVGDIIRIDYGGDLAGHTSRSWDHVAVLFEDRSDPEGPHRGKPDGRLDRFDRVVHMGHPRLKVEPIGGQSPATIDVLRWRRRR